MSIIIEGKPLNEWIEEQKEKDGVMIVHRGTQRTEYGSSTYRGAIVTPRADQDIRYENADISLRVNGKEYRMTGNLVERKGGIWYVDGSIVDMPEQKQAPHMAEDITEMKEKVKDKLDDAVNSFFNAFGKNNSNYNQSGSKHKSSSHGFNIKNDYTGGEIIDNGAGSTTTITGRRTIIKGGSVNIRRGDRTYTIKGNTIEKVDGRWYADGKAVDWDSIGGEYTESNVISIEINGNVQNLATTSGDVTVNGNVQNIRTGSGDVECNDAVNVNTGSGDVHCKNITGMVSTGSGDIYNR